MRTVFKILELLYAWSLLKYRAVTVLRVADSPVVEVALKFLVLGFAVDIGYLGGLHTLTRGLLVGILERVLIKVNRRWPEPLRSGLLIGQLSGQSY